MFDVGFWELVVIFVIGLLVLGPERLPRVATQIGQWAGKARRMARMLGNQLQDEMNAVDPRRIMDPPPAPRPTASSAWSRPGVDDLKADAPTVDEHPGDAGEPRSAAPTGNSQP